MSALVLYRSEYGHSAQYAHWLGKAISANPTDLTDRRPTPLAGAACAVFVLPVYAGNALSLDRVKQLVEAAPEVPVAIVTVSSSDLAHDAGPREAVLKAAKKSLGDELFVRTNWFHVRGGMNYDELRFMHRMMMRFVAGRMKSAAAKGDENAKTFMEGYGKNVDHSSVEQLEPVISWANAKSSTPGDVT